MRLIAQCIDCKTSLYFCHLRSNLFRSLFFVAVYCQFCKNILFCLLGQSLIDADLYVYIYLYVIFKYDKDM